MQCLLDLPGAQDVISVLEGLVSLLVLVKVFLCRAALTSSEIGLVIFWHLVLMED